MSKERQKVGKLKESSKHLKNSSPLSFSNPLTFAMSKGQEYIDRGNATDDALIKQTREVAW